MNQLLLCFMATLFIGLCQGRSLEESHRYVLHRSTRQVNTYLLQLEAIVLEECQINNHTDLQDELQESISNLRKCFEKTQLYSVPKNEYIKHIEDCSQDTVKRVKLCLNDKQQYFPGLILDESISLVSFLYDHRDASNDLLICQGYLQQFSATVKYQECLLSAAKETHDSPTVPDNKADFCRSFLAAVECVPKQLKEFCDNNDVLTRYRKDYVTAFRRPCGFNESEPLLSII